MVWRPLPIPRIPRVLGFKVSGFKVLGLGFGVQGFLKAADRLRAGGSLSQRQEHVDMPQLLAKAEGEDARIIHAAMPLL